MKIGEEILDLFGLQIKKKEENKNLSGALSTGFDEDGASVFSSTSGLSGSFGSYLDVDGTTKSEAEAIRKYREIALFAEVDVAIQEIVDEAIPQEKDTKMVKLNLDQIENISSGIKNKIQEEFKTICSLLKYDNMAPELFRSWYVDGKIAYQIIVDKDNLSEGIQKLIFLDAQNIKKIKEVTTRKTAEGATVIDKVDEYFLYGESGFGTNKATIQTKLTTNNLKISIDSVIFVPSGVIDTNTGMILSYLHKAIRPINQLRMLEDATVIYFIARAPERRVFYIDVGNLPKLKAEQYLKDIMNRYRNKMVYDAKTGDVKNDKKYMSMLEDFWMPRREGGKGTEISTLPGAQNVSGYLDSLEVFKEKMYEALNIPKGRIESEGGFNIGRSVEISRDEVKFQKFIDRLRNKFSILILDALKKQLILKNIISEEDWEEIAQDLRIDFQKDNYFAELKNQEILQTRFTMLQQVDNYLQKYVSKEWVQKNICMLSDEEIKIMDQQIEAESEDESCWPDWKLQGQFQMDQQQEMASQQGEIPFGGQSSGQSPNGDTPPKNEPEYDPSNYGQK